MDGTHVELTFGEAVKKLEAGVPYIIKWTKANDYEDDAEHNIVDPVFTDVKVVSSSDADMTISKANGHVKFIGYYDAFTINTPANDDIYYMTAGNTLKHTGKQRTLKACRAYFQFSEAATSRQFVLNFGDNDATGVAEMKNGNDEMRNGAWYTLDGVKLDKKPTRKGLYIFNGHKVVIK